MIKERIKNFDYSINFIEAIRDTIDVEILKRVANYLIVQLKELKEIFIMSVTYNEVN